MPKNRKPSCLQLLPVLHIYCEGEKTEPNYLNSYIKAKFPGERRLRVEQTRKTTPIQLVDVAVAHKKRRDCPKHDIFWVVFDRESPTKYRDDLHQQARNKADANGVMVALSNVCFEIWLYLHFQQSTSAYSCCDDFIANSNFRNHLKTLGIDNYEKGSPAIANRMTDAHIAAARTNAVAMNKATEAAAPQGVVQPHRLNPYTEVHLLLDAIDSLMGTA